MAEPVFAVDEVRYRPDEEKTAERLFMGYSLEAIERYRPWETRDIDEATFTPLRQINLPWYEIFARISDADEDRDWMEYLGEYFQAILEPTNAVLLYLSGTGTPKLFP